MCILAVQFLVLPRHTRSVGDAIEDLVGGVLAGVLLFVKVTYGMAAVGLVLFCLLRNGQWHRLPRTMTGLVVGLTLCLWGIGSVSAFWSDQAMIASAATMSSRIGDVFFRCRNDPSTLCTLLVFAIAFTGVLGAQRDKHIRKPWGRELIGMAFLVAIGLFLCASNAQYYDIPLVVIAFFVLAEQSRRLLCAGHEPHDTHFLCSWSALLVLGLMMLLAPIFTTDGKSIVYSWYWKHTRQGSSQAAVIETPSLAAMLTDSRDPYASVVNDGIGLLKKHELAGARIMSLTANSPFPFALSLPSPKGGATGLLYTRLCSDRCYPAPERFLGDVTHVLAPKASYPLLNKTDSWMERVYGPYVKQHFQQVGESSCWMLYIRDR
jgi:hypothetical protein